MSQTTPAELDGYLKERHAWFEKAVQKYAHVTGINAADVQGRLSWLVNVCLYPHQPSEAPSMEPEAAQLLVKSINRLLIETCIRARDNSIQRRSGVIEHRDLLTCLVNNDLLGSLWHRHGCTSTFEALTMPDRWDKPIGSWNHPAVPSASTHPLEMQAVLSALADEINVLNDTLSYKRI